MSLSPQLTPGQEPAPLPTMHHYAAALSANTDNYYRVS